MANARLNMIGSRLQPYTLIVKIGFLSATILGSAARLASEDCPLLGRREQVFVLVSPEKYLPGLGHQPQVLSMFAASNLIYPGGERILIAYKRVQGTI